MSVLTTAVPDLLPGHSGAVYAPSFYADGSDETARMLAAITKMAPTGGTIVLPRGTVGFTGELLIPNGVNVIGAGSGGVGSVPTTLKALSAATHLQFGATGVGTWGGESGGFSVDANSIATTPFRLGQTVSRTFRDIRVVNAALGGSGILIQEAQNCIFQAVRVEDCLGDGWTLDAGAGGHTFILCNARPMGRYGLVFKQSYATPALYLYPSSNIFIGCIWEDDTASTLAVVRHEAGLDNTFHRCNFVSLRGIIIDMALVGGASGNLLLNDSVIFGDSADVVGIQMAANTSVSIQGRTRIQACQFAYKLDGLAGIYEGPNVDFASLVGTVATGTFAASYDDLRNPSSANSSPIAPNFIKLKERLGTSVAQADQVNIFARDNGAGKTQICAQFASGAVQVIATQP